MSIVILPEARAYLRIIGTDLDPAITVAMAAAESEVAGFIGGDTPATRWPDPVPAPGDVKAAALMLVRLHFEESNAVQAELWRGIAQRLLVRYRTDSGIGGA